jgi:ADP-ribosylglycohydrolase
VSWTPFPLAHDIAALTHNHPQACLAAGATATLLQKLLVGESLQDAVEAAWRKTEQAGGRGIAEAMEQALQAADDGEPTIARCLEILGEPTATSALALAVFATASTSDPMGAMTAVVQTGGPASRLGALTGQISGALHGPALPDALVDALEARRAVITVAEDLYRHFSGVPFALSEDEWDRYPG